MGDYCGNVCLRVSGGMCVCISLLDVGFPAPLGVGEFGGVTVGRSSVDPAPSVSTDPK